MIQMCSFSKRLACKHDVTILVKQLLIAKKGLICDKM